jgi:hypothetical protein
MGERRANSFISLQEEQAKRRKVEEELRTLKRSQGLAASRPSTSRGALSPR